MAGFYSAVDIGLLRSQNSRFSALLGDWWRALPEGAPLLDATHWRRAVAALTPKSFSDSVDHRYIQAMKAATAG